VDFGWYLRFNAYSNPDTNAYPYANSDTDTDTDTDSNAYSDTDADSNTHADTELCCLRGGHFVFAQPGCHQ
jgi:hypothetical protein